MSRGSGIEIRVDGCEAVISPTQEMISKRRHLRALVDRIEAFIDTSEESLPTHLVFDFSRVDWISSAGLNELIRIQQRTRASGMSLQIRTLSETVKEVFRITRLERIFDLDATEPFESAADESIGENSMSPVA